MPRLDAPNLDLEKLYDLSVEQPMKKTASHRIKLSDSQDRFTKVAFDLFRDSQSEFIWKLEKDSETGDEYIIRTAEIDPIYRKAQNWSTEVDQKKTIIALVYKGHAITSFKKADLQIEETDVNEWRQYLIDKIQTDPSFLKNVLSQVGENRRNYILGKFPELK